VVLLVGAGFLVSQGKSEELAVNSNETNVGQTDVETTSVDNPVVTVPITKGSEWESLARSVVFIKAQGSQCGWTGSGSIVADGSYVLTNQHVAGNGECNLTVWLTDSTTTSPTKYLTGQFVEADSSRDLAIIRMIDSDGVPYIDETRTPLKFSNSLPKLGDKLTILGYPGLGGSSITLTSGDFSGVDSSEDFDFLKTTANMNPGVSGGAALNSDGELVGIPTAGRGAEVACNQQSDCVANGSTIGLLRPVSLASELLARIGS
jgi:S1-C subfamily serine protease